MRRLAAALLLALAAGAQAQQGGTYPSGYEGLSYPAAPPEGLSYPSGYEDPRIAAAEARVQEQDILGTLDRIDRQLLGLAEDIGGMQRQLDGVEARRRQAEDTLAAAEAGMQQEAAQVAARCRALYRLARQGLARVLFGAESPVEIRRRTHYLLSILEHDRKRVAGFVRTVEQRRAALQQVDADRATVAALQAELRIKEAALRDERARKLTLLQQVRERKDLATRVLSQRDQAMAAMERTTRDPLGSATTAPSSNASFRASHGSLPWPTTGTVTGGFGWVDDPLTGQRMFSNGIKISAAYGTPFRAVFPGVVKRAGFISSFGQTVVLDHGAYTTVYAHANGLKVSTGQSVEAGEVLGFVGNSGLVSATDYVLYFEVRYNGTPQDPIVWLGPQR